MVHFRSPSWLIPAASHDGFSTDVHHHGSFTTAARGGLTPAPACRCRRTYLHLCNSIVAVDHSVFYIRTTQLPSGHTHAVADRLSGPTRMLGSCVMVVLTESASPGSGVAVAAAKPKPGDADAAFVQLQRRLRPFESVDASELAQERTIVAIPSIDLDRWVLDAHASELPALEERCLY